MFFVVVLCVLAINRLRPFKNAGAEVLFKNSWSIIKRIILGGLVVTAWYRYAGWLNIAHHNEGFALQPMIVSDKEVLDWVLTRVKNIWLFQYYTAGTYILVGCMVLFMILFFRKTDRLLRNIIFFYGLGSLCYIYLFSYQFMYHDYYFIAVIPFFFFLMLGFADCLNKLSMRYSRMLMLAFFILMFFNIRSGTKECKENYFFRFDSRVYLCGDFRPYYDLAPKLRAIGISPEEKIASAFDDTHSGSLYFMDQPGFNISGDLVKDDIQKLLDTRHIKYLIVNDSARFNKVYPNDFSKKIVLVHRGLILYKIK